MLNVLKKHQNSGTITICQIIGSYHKEAYFETEIERQVFLTPIEPKLAKKLTACAKQRGISTETLINVWLGEKLVEGSHSK